MPDVEREREQALQGEAPSVEVPRLDQLLRALPSATGDARTQIAGQINELLIAMRAPGHEDEEGRVVLRGLQLGNLTDLIDEKGRDCRAEAVETLLACGFPHALSVDPKDLEAFRGRKAIGGGSTARFLAWSGLLSAGGALTAGLITGSLSEAGFIGSGLFAVAIVVSIMRTADSD
jgi:hypothetical protein